MENDTLLISDKKTYQKSTHGQDCIGPCYEPGIRIMHPMTLNYVRHKTEPFCPTNEWEYEDKYTGKKLKLYIDSCENPIRKGEINENEISMNMLLPWINFDCGHFLKIYYKIFSFDDGITWINKNKNTPYLTKLRILECCWKYYGYQDDFVITDELIDLYISIIKNKWIHDIYHKFKGMIVVDNDKIFIGKDVDDNKDNKDKYKVEKINYIVKKLLDRNTIYKILLRYIKKFYSKWNEVKSHNKNIKLFIMEYLDNKLTS